MNVSNNTFVFLHSAQCFLSLILNDFFFRANYMKDTGLHFFLTWQKIYPVHKQTENGSKIALYHFFKFLFVIATFQIFFTWIFSFSTGLVLNHCIRFTVCLWLTYNSITVHIGELVWSGKVNQFTFVSLSGLI